MEELFSWIKNHKRIVVGILFVIIFVIPILINILFKLKAPIKLLESEWEAADMLGYYGSVLGFLSTTLLSTLAIWQNEKIKQLEEAKEAPVLLCQNMGCSGNYGNLNISLLNANANSVVYEIKPIELNIVNKSRTIISSDEKGSIDRKSLGGNETIATIKFKNKSIHEDNVWIIFKVKCFDLYQKEHTYEFRQFIEKRTVFSGDTPYLRREL